MDASLLNKKTQLYKRVVNPRMINDHLTKSHNNGRPRKDLLQNQVKAPKDLTRRKYLSK